MGIAHAISKLGISWVHLARLPRRYNREERRLPNRADLVTRDESKASFAIIRYNFRTYESGGVMAVIKGRGSAEARVGQLEGGQSEEVRHAGCRYFLEKTDLKPGMDPERATRLRQMRLDSRESGF